jgi:hypothetical protein
MAMAIVVVGPGADRRNPVPLVGDPNADNFT